MSKVTQSAFNAQIPPIPSALTDLPSLPDLADIAELISTLNEKMQAVLAYSKACKANDQDQTDQGLSAMQNQQAKQNLDAIQNPQTETKQDLGRHASQTETAMQDSVLHEQQDVSKNLINGNAKPNASDTFDTSNTSDLLNANSLQQATKPPFSKRAKRKECYKEYCYDPNDNRAFTNKETASYFDSAYISGNFSSEIRYYRVPTSIVRHEHRLLCRYQQKDMMSLLHCTYNELDLRSRILYDMIKDKVGLPIFPISYSISQSLDRLHTICKHLNHHKLVYKTMIPKQKKQ